MDIAIMAREGDLGLAKRAGEPDQALADPLGRSGGRPCRDSLRMGSSEEPLKEGADTG